MTIIVLAAGRGLRLGREGPKVLLEIGGRSLLERHRSAFRAHGIDRQIWVVGYRAGEISDALARTEGEYQLVVNSEFAETGSGYSLMLGLEATDDATAFIDADLFYDPALMAALEGGESGIVFSRRTALDAEAVKTYGDSSRLAALRKGEFPDAAVLGESVGLGCLSAADAARLVEIMRSAESESGPEFEWESMIELLARERALRTFETDRAWVEIDFEGDVVTANMLASGVEQ